MSKSPKPVAGRSIGQNLTKTLNKVRTAVQQDAGGTGTLNKK